VSATDDLETLSLASREELDHGSRNNTEERIDSTMSQLTCGEHPAIDLSHILSSSL
jgi:hypothetical protein